MRTRLLRASRLAVIAVLLSGVAACSGDPATPDKPESETAAAPAPQVKALELDTITQGLADSVDQDKASDPVKRQFGLFNLYGQLHGTLQHCVMDYLADAPGDGCETGDLESKRTWVLWGDERAAQWLPGLLTLAEQRGARLVTFTKFLCPPLSGVTPWLAPEGRSYSECEPYNEETLAKVLKLDPDLLIMAGARRDYLIDAGGYPQESTAAFDRGFGAMLDQVAAGGRTAEDTYVLGDTPYQRKEPDECLPRHKDDPNACATSRRKALEMTPEDEKKFVEDHGLGYVPVDDLFCTDTLCPVVMPESAMYRDIWTINFDYSLRLRGVIAERLGLGKEG